MSERCQSCGGYHSSTTVGCPGPEATIPMRQLPATPTDPYTKLEALRDELLAEAARVDKLHGKRLSFQRRLEGQAYRDSAGRLTAAIAELRAGGGK